MFREGSRFCEERVGRDGQGDGVLFRLALNERYLCRAYRILADQFKDPVEMAGSLKEAIDYGQKAVSHFQTLADRDPDHYQNHWELHVAQRELGELYLGIQQGTAAIPHYNMARKTLKSMAAKHGKVVSRMATIQQWLAMVDYNLSIA